MRSLINLNTRGTSSLTYTDDRTAAVIFDRLTPTNQSLTTAVGQAHTQQPGILITEIVKPDLLDVYYEIDVGSVVGATVSWASLPGGVTLNNLGSGKYRITNIDTVAQWNAIKNPTVNIPGGWDDNFVYTAGIYYEPSLSKVWTNSVAVTVRAQITSTVTLTGSITGIQKSFVNMNAALTISKLLAGFRQTVTSNMTSQTSLSGSGRYLIGKLRGALVASAAVSPFVGRNRTFSAALTAVDTISCSIKVFYLQKAQASMTSTSSMTTSSTIVRGFISTNLAVTATVNAIPNNIIISIEIAEPTANYSNQIFGMMNGHFKDNITPTASSRHMVGGTLDISTNSQGVRIWLGTNYPTPFEADLLIDSGSDAETVDGGNGFTGNSDMSKVAFAAYDSYGGDGLGNDIYFYDRTDTTWTRTNKINIPSARLASLSDIGMSMNGQYLAYAFVDNFDPTVTGKIYIYQYSSGSWSQISTINIDLPSQTTVRISDDGNYVFLASLTTSTVSNITYQRSCKVYFRSSGTYSLQQTIDLGSTNDGSQFSNNGLAITPAGDYLVIGKDSVINYTKIIPISLGQSTTLVGGIQFSPTVLSGIPTTSQSSVGNGIVLTSTTGFTNSFSYIQIGNEVFSYNSITSVSNRLDSVSRGRGIYPNSTYAAGTTVRQVATFRTEVSTIPGELYVYKRTGTNWALEQTLKPEGVWINEWSRHIGINGTINHIQVLASSSGSGNRYINFRRV